MCEVPFLEAPELFGVVKDPRAYNHCHVKRQPDTPAELDRMVSAVRCAELQCIRYRGSNRLLQLRLIGAGEAGICDGLTADSQPGTGPSPDSPRLWWRFW